VAKFRPGQSVLFRGKEGVVENVDLTPGMVDVRYGRLVKRHSAGDLQVVGGTKSNPRRNPKKKGPPKPPEPTRVDAANDLRGAEDKLQSLKRALGQAQTRRTQFQDWALWERAFDIAEGRLPDPRTPAYEAAIGELKAIEAKQGPLQKRDRLAVLKKHGVVDINHMWGRVLSARGELQKRKDQRAAFPDQERLNTAQYLTELSGDVAKAQERIKRQEKEVAALRRRFKAFPKKQRQAAPATTRQGRTEPIPGTHPLTGKALKGVSTPVRRKETSTLRDDAFTVGGNQVVQAGAAWLVLPDPPRLTEKIVGRGYYDELCGNPIDGMMYVLAVSTKRRPLPFVVKEPEWAEAYAGLKKTGRISPQSRPEDVGEQVVREIAAGMGWEQFTISPKGRNWNPAEDEEASSTLVPFTPEDRARVRRGEPLPAQYTRGRKGPARSRGADLHKEQLPKETYFYEISPGRFAAYMIYRQGVMSFTDLAKFTPPYGKGSAKSYSPLFSWVGLRRPLAAGPAAFRSSPLCTVGDYAKMQKQAEIALGPLWGLKKGMLSLRYRMHEVLQELHWTEGESRIKLQSIYSAGEKALRNLAWFASWAQDVALTRKRLPSEKLAKEIPELLLFDAAIQRGGVDPAKILATATATPVPMVRRGGKAARIIGAERLGHAARVKMQKEFKAEGGIPQRFRAIEMGSGFSWEKKEGEKRQLEVQRDVLLHEQATEGVLSDSEKKALSRVTAQLAQIEVAQNRNLIGAFNNAMLSQTGPTVAAKMASLVANRLIEAKLRPGGKKKAALRAQLDKAGTVLSDRAADEKLNRLRQAVADGIRLERGATALREEKAQVKQVEAYVKRLRALRTLFFLYESLGGDETLRQLDASITVFQQVKEDGGRLPSKEVLTLLKKQRELKAKRDERIAERDAKRRKPRAPRDRGQFRIKQRGGTLTGQWEGGDPPEKLVAEEQMLKEIRRRLSLLTQGSLLQRLGTVRLFYTFNPLLFYMTKEMWRVGTPWPLDKQGRLTQADRTTLGRVDLVGRYGHALQLFYEQGVGAENLQDLAGKIEQKLGVTRFVDNIHADIDEHLGDGEYTPEEEDKRTNALLQSLTKRLRESLDLDLLSPGRGGKSHFYRKGARGSQGWLVSAYRNETPYMEATRLASEPVEYLSELRQDARAATLRQTREMADRKRLASGQPGLEDLAGVGPKMAKDIRRTLGVADISGLATVRLDTLMGVPGIGKSRGKAILRQAKAWHLRGEAPAKVTSRKERRERREKRGVFATPQAKWAPLQPLSLYSQGPYTRTSQIDPDAEERVWIPPGAAVAALDHLEGDSNRLRKAINQRLKQLLGLKDST